MLLSSVQAPSLRRFLLGELETDHNLECVLVRRAAHVKIPGVLLQRAAIVKTVRVPVEVILVAEVEEGNGTRSTLWLVI